MADIRIAICNASSVVTNSEIKAMSDAVQMQIYRDFAPEWGVDAELTCIRQGERPDETMWWLIILDDSDQAGALGYHDMTSAGLPLGKIFAKSDLDSDYQVSVSLSHALLEMLADPAINLLVQLNTTQFYAYEVCNPVVGMSYKVNDIEVSDFVLPAYFELFLKKGRFDFMGLLEAPLPTMASGGYLLYFDVSNGQWYHNIDRTQQTTPQDLFLTRPRVGSRRHRRMLRREEWLPSEVPHRPIRRR
jgi:hypothetical protein